MPKTEKPKLSKSGKFKVPNAGFIPGTKNPMGSSSSYSGGGHVSKRTGTRGDK
ncbi:hypothetical protein HQ524_02935 [Candidatus Uhrbacteria bacterium]|nr:hypothetical protein [Candidatus Uhrbacteria bacterium]